MTKIVSDNCKRALFDTFTLSTEFTQVFYSISFIHNPSKKTEVKSDNLTKKTHLFYWKINQQKRHGYLKKIHRNVEIWTGRKKTVANYEKKWRQPETW